MNIIKHKNNREYKIEDEVRNEVRDEVRDEIEDEIRNKVRNKVGDNDAMKFEVYECTVGGM